jgi:hypothetical protein
MNPILTKSFNVGAPVGPNQVVKFSASGTVVLASAQTDSIIGVTRPQMLGVVGGRVDVTQMGIAECAAGGVVTRGDKVTTDVNGNVVTLVGAGRCLGIAQESAVAGDLFPVLVNLS